MPMFNSRLAIQANRLVKSPSQVHSKNTSSQRQTKAGANNITANDMGAGFSPPMGGGSTSAPMSTMGFGGPAFNTTFMGILPEYNENLLLQYYRDCYYYDSVGGATVDIISSFPFSEWTLAGVDNDKIVKFNDSLARLNMRSLLQEVSNAYLVDSAFIGSLVYDQDNKVFQDILIHDFANASVTAQPFYGIDPVISVNTTNALNQFLNAGSPFVAEVMQNYPKSLIKTFMGGSTILDPLTTLYIPRKGMQDRTSSSYLKRLLPVYMLEKILYRGTLTEATKRLRSTSHIKVGDDTWEPNNNEMASILADFQRSELDPLGAWIVTRQGVEVSEVRSAGEMWKWTDNIDTLTPFKLRALGISEAFLSGDACMVGETVVQTSLGEMTLSDIGERFNLPKDGKQHRIDLQVLSRFGMETATHWMYSGYREVFKITTESGNSVTCTGNHKLLVIREDQTVSEAEWLTTNDIVEGDCLVIQTATVNDALVPTWNRDNITSQVKTRITSVTNLRERHVYDITVDREPAFVANGIISHNSFATAETAVSVFMENMDAYRKYLTYKMFTNKIFPLIAVLNGFYKDKSRSIPIRNSADLMANLSNNNNLEIPEVHWHKSLEAKSAESDFDMLEKLSDKGFSIPLKMWSAAAGVDLNMMLRDLDEDKEIRTRIEKVTGIPAHQQGRNGEDNGDNQDEQDEGRNMEFSARAQAMHPGNMGSRPASVRAASRSVPLLARDFEQFDPASARVSKSGNKVHAVLNERGSKTRINELIVKAAKALQDPNHRESIRKNAKDKLGNKTNLGLF